MQGSSNWSPVSQRSSMDITCWRCCLGFSLCVRCCHCLALGLVCRRHNKPGSRRENVIAGGSLQLRGVCGPYTHPSLPEQGLQGGIVEAGWSSASQPLLSCISQSLHCLSVYHDTADQAHENRLDVPVERQSLWLHSRWKSMTP